MHLPAKTLIARKWPITSEALSYEDFAQADILVFLRLKSEMAVREIAGWKAKGKKIVVDLDDNFFLLEDSNPAKRVFNAEALKWQAYACELADALTVTTKPLADSYARFNNNIYVLPNMIDADNLVRERRVGGPVIAGWQGTATHAADLKIIKSPINALTRRHDLIFVLCGFEPRGTFNNTVFRPWVNFTDELPHLNNIDDFSIGLCPLANTPFNECKSDIKFLEYSILGIPTIASRSAAYSSIAHDKIGYVARNVSDWEKYLKKLIADEARRNELGLRAKNYVASERTIQGNIERWEEVYDSL